MTRKLIGQIIITGAIGGAVALTPAATMAQTNIPCPGIGSPACSTFNIPVATSSASGFQSSNITNSGNAGPSFIVSAPQQTVVSSAAAQNGSQNGSFNGGHAVSVGGRTFRAAGGEESFVSLGVGGASNTGGAALGG